MRTVTCHKKDSTISSVLNLIEALGCEVTSLAIDTKGDQTIENGLIASLEHARKGFISNAHSNMLWNLELRVRSAFEFERGVQRYSAKREDRAIASAWLSVAGEGA